MNPFKIVPLIFMSLIFLGYGFFLYVDISQLFFHNQAIKTYLLFWLIAFYPNLRLLIDYLLILYSFHDDLSTRKLIFKISKSRVRVEKSWSERNYGIYKWCWISLGILLIRIIYEFI